MLVLRHSHRRKHLECFGKVLLGFCDQTFTGVVRPRRYQSDALRCWNGTTQGVKHGQTQN